MAFVRKLHGFYTKTCAEDSIESGRCTAALQMSEHAGARFFSGLFGDFARDHLADSAKTKFATFDVALDLLTVFWPRAFRYDNERAKPASGFALLNRRSNFVVIERDFGNQNNIGATRNAAMKRDPPP